MDLDIELRQAETRKQEYERQHQEALSALRNSTSASPDIDSKQSRIRELEKKIALETVRVEELQLELASQNKSCGLTNNNQQWGSKGTEIERIMAKIEQDNRILAELDHSRSTTLGRTT